MSQVSWGKGKLLRRFVKNLRVRGGRVDRGGELEDHESRAPLRLSTGRRSNLAAGVS